MAEKKKTRLIDLVQTRGSFSVSGLVTGTDKDSFYEDKLTPVSYTHLDVYKRQEQRIWKMPPSEDRAKNRAKTFPGIARAMAEQWAGDIRED